MCSALLPQPELISHWGYPGETHTVQTEDGFYLDVHRITGGRGQSDKPGGRKKAPILLAHGYGATSECMVLREHDNLGKRRFGRVLFYARQSILESRPGMCVTVAAHPSLENKETAVTTIPAARESRRGSSVRGLIRNAKEPPKKMAMDRDPCTWRASPDLIPAGTLIRGV